MKTLFVMIAAFTLLLSCAEDEEQSSAKVILEGGEVVVNYSFMAFIEKADAVELAKLVYKEDRAEFVEALKRIPKERVVMMEEGTRLKVHETDADARVFRAAFADGSDAEGVWMFFNEQQFTPVDR